MKYSSLLKNLWFFILLIQLSSCSKFINSVESESFEVINPKNEQFSILFSGNINGETHPCGCRHFPLGGLPNVAGLHHELKKTKDILYVDAGDTFFPNSTLPAALKDSLSFAAENLAKGLAQLGLKYFVPGDQDFAAGYDFLKRILDENKILVLASNIKNPTSFNHKTWIKIKKGPHLIYVTGIVDPTVLPSQWQYLFSPVNSGFEKVYQEMKNDGFDEKSPFHRLVVVSNAGMEPDKSFAKSYPMISWILGAHSQSFTNVSFDVGKTQLVQTLSRNHYVGEVSFALSKDKKKDGFMLHEMREEKGKLLKDNSFYAFIDAHKAKLTKIQEEEQSRFVTQGSANDKRGTAASCLECHEDQGNKWKSTAHSLAFVTLVNANQQFNLECIQCHSFGLNEKGGFNKAEELVHVEQEDDKKKKTQNQIYKNYVSEMQKAFGKISSVRKLSGKTLKRQANKLLAIEDKLNIAHNFSGVQCLNCHDKAADHPFEKVTPVKISAAAKFSAIKEKCMNCHDPDQSPEWYKNGTLDAAKFKKTYQAIACPKRNEEY